MSSPFKNESDEEYENESDPELTNESEEGLTDKILSTINLIRTPYAFAYSTVDASLPNPILHIPPHGTVALPLYPDDTPKIISQASQSPFGKGEETLIDTTFRRSWELNPNQFSLKNPTWNKAIESIVDTATTALGLEPGKQKVTAELYKLLLYEPGAFFKPHKDSEKAPGMFATLVVCLPSPHEGGKVVLTHDNEKHEFETASSSSFGCSYAAWYSDITHEVLPVASGYRLVLTYNLILETGFGVPLQHNVIRGHVKQLTKLLEEYNLALEKGNDQLSPMIVYKLEHNYSQANLKLNALKPPDIAQVEILRQVSTELEFCVYLATLELRVGKDDERPDFKEEYQSFENMVELDGELVVKSFDYPKVMYPIRQDMREADKEEHEGYTGNEGAPATYWYRDTVVVLVPPAKRLDFIFEFLSYNYIIEPLFFKVWQELSSDSAKKPKLEQLCELALKQKVFWHYNYDCQSKDSIPFYFRQAAVTALDLGRIDLFNEACKSSEDKIVLANAGVLGRWAADKGVSTITDQLMKGVLVASSIAEKVEFLRAVAEGFETAVQEPSSAERDKLKQWSDEAVLTAAAHLKTLTESDVKSLAQLCKTVDWSLFESKMKPIVLQVVAMSKITFIDELMSTLQPELNVEQRLFIVMIIRSIWNKFAFNAKCDKSKPQASAYSYWGNKDFLKLNDLLLIIGKTVTILSSKCVETIILPAMLTAIPVASKVCTEELFIPLVRMILKNEVAHFRSVTDGAVPLLVYKHLVQALLTKFVLENVPLEPQAPTNWSLPARLCICKDCTMVNRFLQDPRERSLAFRCSLTQSGHLQSKFKVPFNTSGYRNTAYSETSYNIQTTVERTSIIWRITKHNRSYENKKSEWLSNVGTVTQTLAELEKVESPKGRLGTYLQPYYSVIMNAKIKELPDLKSLVAVPQSRESNENSALPHNKLTKETSHKRGIGNNDLTEDGLAKRTKS